MAKWILKAVVQKGISYLPYKEDLNFFFQKYVTRGVALTDEHFIYKLEAARDHLRFYDRFGTVPLAEARVLELGTGWYPIVPAIFYLAGCNHIESIDIRNWLSQERTRIAYRKILEYHDSGQLIAYLPYADPNRINSLRRICDEGYAESGVGSRESGVGSRESGVGSRDYKRTLWTLRNYHFPTTRLILSVPTTPSSTFTNLSCGTS